MELKRLTCGILICLSLLTLWVSAAGARVAMVLETKGQNLLLSPKGKTEMRTLQVLTDGDEVEISEGAVLRLSYFKNGVKESISGPCKVKLGPTKSQKLSGSGKIETQAARNASTELDESSNLRRTGGAMQASTGIVPENQLAFTRTRSSAPTPAPPPPAPITYNSSVSTKPTAAAADSATGGAGASTQEATPKMEFVGLSYAYLYPEEVGAIAWTPKGNYQFELDVVSGTAYSDKVVGDKIRIPVGRLTRGEVHKAVLKQSNHQKSQFFKIFSKQEAKEYCGLVTAIKSEEAEDPRAMYSKLIYLNAQLGLLTRARALCKEALKQYPNDEGFKIALKEVNQKLGLSE